MTTQLNAGQRAVVLELANAILPGSDTQPAAAAIEIQFAAIDRSLRSRPDLAAEFVRLLDQFQGEVEVFLQALTDSEFDLLMTLICAAYVMDATVRKALGYFGQQALTPNRGGFGAEDLVIEMMQQPKRFRDA